MADAIANLYVHFPFCRGKCSYCALYSKPGISELERNDYARSLAAQLERRAEGHRFRTVYFGGGTPAYCDLRPVLRSVSSYLAADYEFTVELHPLDVNEETLAILRDGGVNRISMGVQSLDDDTLSRMGRGYTYQTAAAAFSRVKRCFDNAGIDLIVGYSENELGPDMRLGEVVSGWGLRHCSVYSLQNERGLKNVLDDDAVMNRLTQVGAALKANGLNRYEISNYAQSGFECRHNLAVWRGEDYLGIGEGACGRLGLVRTLGLADFKTRSETLDARRDKLERTLFRLRTREGLDASAHPEWHEVLRRFESEGLLISRAGNIWCLTARGAEVCDTILAELI